MSDAADRLRRAADRIESRAAAATPGAWEIELKYPGNDVQTIFVMDPENPDSTERTDIGALDRYEDRRWAALMGPSIAGPLMALLRAEAHDVDAAIAELGTDVSVPVDSACLAIADVILDQQEWLR